MKIFYQVTSETIRENVTDAIQDCIENGWIAVPADAMEEFISECTEEIENSYETAEFYPHTYIPDYTDTVMDAAKWYDYLTEGGK